MARKRHFAPRSEDPHVRGMRAVFGGKTKVVSDRLNSRAMLCICSVASPSAFSTTASGLPLNWSAVNTSTVSNCRRIFNNYKRHARRGAVM